MKKISLIALAGLLWARPAFAHCPLCTAGAGIAATAAIWLGVNTLVVGIFVGAFAAALGLWTAKLIKKKIIPGQDNLIATVVYLLTVIPILPVAGGDKISYYLSIAGEYGSLLNKTYVFDMFLAGSLLGAIVMLLSPIVSRWLTQFRAGKRFPYQGVTVTFVLLLICGIIFQFVL